MCGGAIFFSQVVEVSILSILSWRKKKKKRWKNEKETFQKKQKIVFLGGCEQKRCFFLCKNGIFLRNWQKHYLCSEGNKKRAFSLQRSVFGKWHFFVTSNSPNTTKIWGFSRHRGKPKMALFVSNVPFWERASKEGLLSVIHKICVLLKTRFYSVLGKAQLCRNKRV